MARGNTVEIILSASDRASGAIRQSFGTIEKANSRVVGAIKAGMAVAATALTAISGLAGKVGVDYNAMAEQSQVAWATLLGSQEKAKRMLQDIANFAKSTPFETASVDIMAKYMHNAGLEGKALFDELMRISDVASAFNIPADSAQELARQMSQVKQAGVAYTEDLNILQDRGVPIFKALASAMGVNVAQVKKMASEGKITSDVYMKAFDNVANSVKGASDAQSKTFTGLISTLKDNLNMIAGELSKPLFEKFKGALDTIMPLLDKFLSGFKRAGLKGAISEMFPYQLAYPMIDALVKMEIAFNKIKDVAKTFFNQMGGMKTIVSVFDTVENAVSKYIDIVKSAFSGDGNIGQSFVKIFNTIKSIALPILQDTVQFIKDKIAMIKQFWDENGAQIIQAIQNVWSVIAAIFKFIAPVILFIVQMLWSNVKGVIDGALKIIMGLIKIFAGLFTGDFSKMWEGIKQLFIGAVEAVWNLINLLMFGRILGGIKAFVTKGISSFQGLWTKTVEIFKNLDTHVWNIITGFVSKIVDKIASLYTEGAQIFGTLRTFGANAFQALWSSIITIAGNIYSAVISRFTSLATGARFQFDGLLNTTKTIFNAVKDAITNPMETAKTLVGKAIEGIKSFFKNISVKIPLPHFSVSNWSLNPKDWVTKGLPKLSVDWYDKGGVFYGPQVIGVGEKRPEFVGALDDLRKIVREETGGKGKGGNTYNITVNKEETANQLVRELQRLEWLHD
jgi:tape measure domain-containing protein